MKRVKRINAYLVDAATVTLKNRKKPISNVNVIQEGSALIDNGNFLLTQDEVDALDEVVKNSVVRRFANGDDFINEFEKTDILHNDFLINKITSVKKFRLKSHRKATKKLAETPHLFGELRQPSKKYLFIPKTSSENRLFVPIGFMDNDVVINNTSLFVDDATLYEFAMLSSTMHNAWLRAVGGRLESRYRYSASVVYNNYPWPADSGSANPAALFRQAIEAAGQALLDVRAKHAGKSLAWLYNRDTMPANIQAAHDAIDAAVDDAYGYVGGDDDAPRVAFLFERYQALTSLFLQGTDGPQDEAQEADTTAVKISSKRTVKRYLKQ
jgi:hypothetical protein